MKKPKLPLTPCLIAAWTIAAVSLPFSPPAAAESGPVATVRSFVDAFNARDLDGMAALVTDDVEWLSVDGRDVGTETEGKAALRSTMEEYFRSCPSCQSELGQVVATGDRVAAVETARWEGKDGPSSQRSLSIYELRDGRIRRVYYYPAEK
jgi:uncharacterized protein (TIGR02246 family)